MSTPDPSKDFKVERYKFILQQQNALNDNLHKYLTLFQTLTTAILTAIVAVLVGWPKLGIGANIARLGVRSLIVVLSVLGFFVVASIVSGMFSWWDNRHEEADLYDEVVGAGSRSRPELGNLWRWYETHALVFVFLSVFGIVVFVEWWIMPNIQ